MEELYDLKHDPYEMANVIGHPDSATVLQHLKSKLDDMLNEN